ncbi:hypothetical protein N7470_003789 [Penicillium chermesinum]|nr:hypothetical protein N7470_003789 [Penicillium chermesinum]
MERTRWLDGLRGLAAGIVAFDHLFMDNIWFPFVSFWTNPPEANRSLVQLPPIRILFSAHAMVTLFMVISGYAISVNLIKDPKSPNLLARISSAIVRRGFRIYLPMLVTAGIAQLFYFLNVYHWEFDEALVAELPRPLSAPWAHVKYLLNYMAQNINIVAFEPPGGLNGQLWTMPLEFRGSNVVYLLITGLSTWRMKLKLYVLPVIGGFFIWYGNWDTFGFIWGLWLAQRAVSATANSGEQSNAELEMAEFDGSHNSTVAFPGTLGHFGPGRRFGRIRMKNKKLILSRLAKALTFVLGYYLLCLGSDGILPPGYQFLSALHPSRWKDKWHIYHWCWKSIGSAMLVYAIGEFPTLQRPLTTRPVQYLGKISFALYLLHETIYQLWRNPFRNFVYLILSGSQYENSGQASGADPFAFYLTWYITGAVLGVVTIVAAHYYTIHVDNRCVALAKRVDRWLSFR